MEPGSDVGRLSRRTETWRVISSAIRLSLTVAAPPVPYVGFTPPEASRDCQPAFYPEPKFKIQIDEEGI